MLISFHLKPNGFKEYQQIKNVFAQVSDLPKDEANKILSRLCADDEPLLKEVQALLSQDINDKFLGQNTYKSIQVLMMNHLHTLDVLKLND